MKKINALSLFDGMGCLGIALKDLGVEFNYFTSEIDKHAIAQSKLNFPDSTQLGDVTKWKEWDIDWSKIDIIGSGSPCQGFSFAGKQLAFDDPRSALFFVFVEILEHTKKLNPNVIFLLENVKMKKEHELVITKYMGVAPIEINAALVSAQNRRRLFWTNIKNEPYGLFGDMQCTIPQPKDRGILLKDILENDVPEKYYLSDKMLKYFSNRAANFNQGKVNIREEEGKASTITASMASCDISDNFIITHSTQPRMGKGQGGKGHLFKTDQKTYCLDTSNSQAIEIKYKIRRLTPTECARLQSIPDWYKWNCSDSQAYKMCGNGWNVEVIKHILQQSLF
jgi:DNA-cytosine methyltransferase